MDSIIHAAVLGLVQGLTEFLPISSSAHLILVPKFLGWNDPFADSAAFDVMLHMGTLAALLIYFRSDLWRYLAAWLASLRDRRIGDDPNRRIAWLLVISVVPAALLGAAFESTFDTAFREQIAWIAVFTLTGAALLWLAERWGTRTPGPRGDDAAGTRRSSASARPSPSSRASAARGSRSRPGLFLGLERDAAARFSFLMSVPVIAGAGLLKARTLVGAGLGAAQAGELVVGVLTSAIFGFIAVAFLLRYLRGHGTGIFIAYRVGFAALIFVVPAVPLTRPGADMEVMKQLRQRSIRDLLGQRAIRTQQELAAALRERGFRATQATISRDVAELGLIKISRDGTQAYALPPRLIEAETSGEDRLRKLLADLPIEIHESGLLLVMRTLPGSAHAIAAALDRARWPEVAGSIAGDDTLFVAFPDRGSLQRIRRRLLRLTGVSRRPERRRV